MTTHAHKVRSIFLAAVENHPPDQWSAYLDEACGADSQLRRRVEILLHAHAESDSLLDDLPSVPAATVDAPITEGPGTVIGPYKLMEQIGEGGMGLVYVAEQQHPINRRVALKIIKPGMETRQVIARFEAERQALALMDHPNIARVLDGGTTESSRTRESSEAGGTLTSFATGRPYFVMELVKGTPITEYCDQNQVSVRERLELFLDVCEAVQHAHQKGIIHRDIKPSNVLVTSHDGKPVVKVIDFGVAKAIGQQLTDKTVYTQFAQMIGTPLYMSPEQAGLSGLDVDTRSDIYSLGVLLYELLTGTTPFDKERFSQVGYDEMRRIIREEEPPKPSTRISTLRQAATTASERRRCDPRKLSRLFRGELDWIVMKALEKDRNRRYETASAFAADVERYLHDEPVQACPPSVGYRLRKFVRRHKGPVLAASVILFLLAAGIVGTTTGLVRVLAAEGRALTERDAKEVALQKAVAAGQVEAEARRQTRLALNTMTDAVVEDLLGRQVQLTDQHREFLKKVLAFHAAFAAAKADDPEGRQAQADGYFRVGAIRFLLGELKDAEAAMRDALEIRKQLADDLGDRSPKGTDYRHDLAVSYNRLGVLLRQTGRHQAAEEAHRAALAIRKELVTQSPNYRLELAGSHTNLGIVLIDLGQWKEAEAAHYAALDLWKDLTRESPKRADYLQQLASSQANLGVLLNDTGRLEEAERYYRDALANNKQLVADFPKHPDYRQDLAKSHYTLGLLLRATGRPDKAEVAFGDALVLQKKLAAEFPIRPDYRHDLVKSHGSLAKLLLDSGQLKVAEQNYRAARDIARQLTTDSTKQAEYRHDLAVSLHGLGDLLLATKRPEQAQPVLREALAIARELVAEFPKSPDFRQQLAFGHNHQGYLLSNTGRQKQAESPFREALAMRRQLAAEFPKRSDLRQELGVSLNNLGGLLLTMGERKKAEAPLREAVNVRRQLVVEFPGVPEYQDDLGGTLRNLALLHKQRQEFGDAVRLLEQARLHHHAAMKANPKNPAYRLNYGADLVVLAECYLGLGDHARAATTAHDLAGRPGANAVDFYVAACFLSCCVPLVARDAQLEEVKRKELAKGYADRAMAGLRQAADAGFKDAAHMKINPGLGPLRAREDFKKLLADLEAKNKP
jgi:serine/threonine protein kinase/tetratricopeptide (TPR) repeat protein